MDTVFFTDESKFNLYFAYGRQRAWCGNGKRYNGGVIYTLIVLVEKVKWCCTDLISLHGRIMCRVYVMYDLLNSLIVLFFEGRRDLQFFQIDNARTRTSKVLEDFLAGQKYDILDWPARSPYV